MLQREFGYTTIVVTHDQVEALSLADRLAVMDGGIIQQYGTPDEVFDDPANIFVAEFVGEPQINMFDGIVRLENGSAVVSVGSAGNLPVSTRNVVEGQSVRAGEPLARIDPTDYTLLADRAEAQRVPEPSLPAGV